MISRSARRPGQGEHIASINPSIWVGTAAPNNPRDKDLWLDTSDKTWYYYDASSDTWL